MLGKQEARVWDLKADPLRSAPARTWQHQGGDSRAETGWSGVRTRGSSNDAPATGAVPSAAPRGPGFRHRPSGCLFADSLLPPLFPWAWGPGGGSGHNSRPERPGRRGRGTLSLTPTGGCLVEAAPEPGWGELRNLLPRRPQAWPEPRESTTQEAVGCSQGAWGKGLPRRCGPQPRAPGKRRPGGQEPQPPHHRGLQSNPGSASPAPFPNTGLGRAQCLSSDPRLSSQIGGSQRPCRAQ